MSGRRRHQIHPFTRLSMAMRVAALNIGKQAFRNLAAREAEHIPVWNCERGGGKRGEVARMGRKLLAKLPELTPDQFEEAAINLVAYADVVGSRFEVVSETSLGERRKRA